MAGNPFRRSTAERLNEVPHEALSSFDSRQTAQQRFPPIDGSGQSFVAQSAEDSLAYSSNPTADNATRSGQSDQRSTWEPLQPSVAFQTNTTRAPANPFARTLATSEAAYGGVSSEVTHEKQAQGLEDKTTQSRLDVDAFTNILLTGSATSIKSGPPKTSFAGVNTVASSSTDMNFDSAMLHTQQPSFFDQGFHQVHPESPRGSFESVKTDSSDDHINDGNMLMGPVASRPEAPAPQAPPKPQRPRGPQTVSFADFDQAIPPDFQSTKSPQRSASPALHGILRPPSLTRKGSDMNKPLPRPPAEPTPAVILSPFTTTTAEEATPAIVADNTAPSMVQATPSVSIEDVESSAAKKAPPPPPASRRQAGTAAPSRPSLQTSSSSSSSIRQPMVESTQESTVNRQQQQQQQFSPPPPPTRKPSRTPSIASIQSTGAGEQQVKPTPPPPPRRQPLRSHASRTSSDDSFKQEATPPSATLPTSSAPPPPPPRRAAGNSAQTTTTASRRTSNESSRPASVYSIDGQQERPTKEPLAQVLETTAANDEDPDDAARRAAAVEQVFEQAAAVAAESSKQGGANLLADMTAFQREIDALMAKSGG